METIANTDNIGNAGAGHLVQFHSERRIDFISVHWDSNKIRGLYIRGIDRRGGTAGDLSSSWTVNFDIMGGNALKTAYLRDSGWGHGSVRQINFTTTLRDHFHVGPDGYDREFGLNVEGKTFAGFNAWVSSSSRNGSALPQHMPVFPKTCSN